MGHVHERYNKGKQFNNDIALMKLAPPACPLKAKTTVAAKTASSPDGDWSNVGPKPSLTVSRRSPAESGVPVSSSANTTAFPTTLLVSANPANGPLAWVTPADPLSATTDPALTTSSVLFPSDPAPAPANPASSPKSLNTEIGFTRNLVAPSKSGSQLFLSTLFVFSFRSKVNKIS